MPKGLFVDPKKVRSAGKITFTDIPVNAYKTPFAEEAKRFSKKDMLNIFRDMAIIRQFETMLHTIKTTGEYKGIAYNHPGPAHLSIGQEAAAVGQAYTLDIDDYIFGSHRSHGEILAKGLSAIEKTGEPRLLDIMKTYFGGRILRCVEQDTKASSTNALTWQLPIGHRFNDFMPLPRGRRASNRPSASGNAPRSGADRQSARRTRQARRRLQTHVRRSDRHP